MKIRENPNVSIVLPGPCNGKCSFCFWDGEKERPNDYHQVLKRTLDKLPEQFQQLSITGGEPTMSPCFDTVLELIERKRWKKVVLTTNSTFLSGKIPLLEGKVDHVNISRHHHEHKINNLIFGWGPNFVTSTSALNNTCNQINKLGIDVTFSCVLTEHLQDKQDVLDYIKAAKLAGASGVYFRHQIGNSLSKPKIEKEFEQHKVIRESFCPVCRSSTQIINGMYTTWKASAKEPSNDSNEVYEVVIQPNGIATIDWEGKRNFFDDEPLNPISAATKALEEALVQLKLLQEENHKLKDRLEGISENYKFKRSIEDDKEERNFGGTCGFSAGC